MELHTGFYTFTTEYILLHLFITLLWKICDRVRSRKAGNFISFITCIHCLNPVILHILVVSILDSCGYCSYEFTCKSSCVDVCFYVFLYMVKCGIPVWWDSCVQPLKNRWTGHQIGLNALKNVRYFSKELFVLFYGCFAYIYVHMYMQCLWQPDEGTRSSGMSYRRLWAYMGARHWTQVPCAFNCWAIAPPPP